ncbi:hypothetical protein T4C_5688 [Trichinella pseudospiralis]|uniref:Uncharacterized protein n=1 Tax=Trichinella pseudospiralis TaxID=6337 RepID=A0A0V1J3X0_TRIPS|nr:hypothetical protein T4C_5688 [Trichinella pseudospiralis]
MLGTGGTVIPEPADQQCGIFEAALRHGVSNKTWRTLLCEGSLEDIGVVVVEVGPVVVNRVDNSWIQVPSCDRSEV